MSNLESLRKTVARLRAPGGCPWDREQTHQSLTQHLIDECSELLETIDKGDMEHMREELGDVLLQVVLHARIAEESGAFDLEAVAGEINEKLIRRHPHVFGDAETKARLDTSDKVLVEWEKIKAAEKAERGTAPEQAPLFKDLPPRLPALLFAFQVYKQIRRRDLAGEGVPDAVEVDAEAGRLDEKELGKRLFALAAGARAAGIDPEAALRRYATDLMQRLEREHAGVSSH